MLAAQPMTPDRDAPPLALDDAPRDGTAIRATHWRKGEFVVRFDAQASRTASHGIWRGHGGSYDESDFDSWRMEAGD